MSLLWLLLAWALLCVPGALLCGLVFSGDEDSVMNGKERSP